MAAGSGRPAVADPEDPTSAGRAFPKSNWERLEGVVSDQSRGVPAPAQQKPCSPGAETVDSVRKRYDGSDLEDVFFALTGLRMRG